MGTFGPAVDYLTAKAKWPDWVNGTTQLSHVTNANTDNFLVQFGYSTAQRDALSYVNVAPVGIVRERSLNLNQKRRDTNRNEIYNVQGRRLKNGGSGEAKGVVLSDLKKKTL
jgi:hypothetical protein